MTGSMICVGVLSLLQQPQETDEALNLAHSSPQEESAGPGYTEHYSRDMVIEDVGLIPTNGPHSCMLN
jgi:hypothetical protein